MCGFTGFIDNSGSTLNYQSILEKCHKTLFFRGPDQNKRYLDNENKIYVNFDRLSFFDLSEDGNQPMISKNKRYLILINGEIYNFKDLNNILEKGNIYTNKKSDIAVSLEFISNYGLDQFLKKAIGMFAMVVIDLLNKELNIISDQFSQKPLYYSIQKNTIFFSSDIRTIHNHKNFDLEINKNSLQEYFNKGYISSPHTIYQNVNKIEPGCKLFISFKNKKIKVFEKQRYNTLQVPHTDKLGSKLDITRIKSTIEKSVLLHLESDVPIGTFLSGGIDSSLVTAIASKYNKNINAFSLGFRNSPNYDESKHAKLISDHLGVNHHICYFDNNLLEEKVLKTGEIYSEPFSDSSQILFADLCEFSSKSVKGILTGDGADELFGGYHRHLTGVNIFNNTRNKLIQKLFILLINISNTKLIQYFLHILSSQYPSEKINRLKNSISAKNIDEFYNLITSQFHFRDIVKNIDELKNEHNLLKNLDYSKYMMWKDLNLYLPNDLLVKSDRASMYNGLEVRSPFLNIDLINEIMPLDSKILFKGGKTKSILRHILIDYLPKELLSVKKMGFSAPINNWLKNDLKKLKEHFLNSKMLSHELFDNNLIKKNIEEFNCGKENHFEIWSLLIFQIWFHKYH